MCFTEGEVDDTGNYKIEVANESGSASCAFKMDVLGKLFQLKKRNTV